MDDPNILYLIFQYINTKKLIQIQKVCKDFNIISKDVLGIRRNIFSRISQFVDNTTSFVQILRNNKVCISGSVALQCLLGENYENHDLDLYLCIDNIYDTQIFSELTSFSDTLLHPRMSSVKCIMDYLVKFERYEVHFFASSSYSPCISLIRDNKKIDLISVPYHSIERIISQFYATHVMNFFSLADNTLYSLLPNSALNHKSFNRVDRSYLTAIDSVDDIYFKERLSEQKYTKRGFTFFEPNEIKNKQFEMYYNFYVEDRYKKWKLYKHSINYNIKELRRKQIEFDEIHISYLCSAYLENSFKPLFKIIEY